MSPACMSRVALVALVAVTGCGEESLTDVSSRDVEEVVDLHLAWPALAPEGRVGPDPRPMEGTSGPAAAFTNEGYADPNDPSTYDEESEYEAARIISPITEVGFRPTYAFSRARHSYIGNLGRVSTEAVVTYGGEVIGRQPAEAQESTPFLLDWGMVKTIATEAYVFTDVDCGLEVTGNSMHEAWWQWFLGGPAPSWGSAKMSSQAFPPVEQPSCDEDDQPVEGSGGADGGGSVVTCWYRVTYDPYTGEVYDSYLLYCDDIGG